MAHRETIVEAVKSIAAVASQMDLALREAQAPVEHLGTAVARIGHTLTTMGGAPAGVPQGGTDMTAGMQLAWGLSQLRRDCNCAVEDLQFHDRMVQHLEHLRDYLTGVGVLLARGIEGDAEDIGPSPASPEDWSALRGQLFQRLITEPQRQFLQLLLPAADEQRTTGDSIIPEYASPGSVELF